MRIEYQDISCEQVQMDNAISIESANKKRAAVVVVDPSKIIGWDREPVNLFNTKELKLWLLRTYQGRKIKINDDNQIVQFTRGGLESDLKNRGEIRRQAYADLDCIIQNSIYYSYELGDVKHFNVNKHRTYYGAINIGSQNYAVRLKINTFAGSDVGLYKDLDIKEI
ncbi:MAG: hypothetical protein FWE57_09535, partial [Chitinispirillia bacterium]|nr:hypothetical protein [Chitinispirillia bacterium]